MSITDTHQGKMSLQFQIDLELHHIIVHEIPHREGLGLRSAISKSYEIARDL